MTMRLLLDTHVAVWSIIAPGRIPLNVRRILLADGAEVFVSAVCLFEIAVKTSLGRRQRMGLTADLAYREFQRAGFALLNVTPAHAIAAGDVAVAHSDPFDRLILAQAVTDAMHLVTHDEQLAQYAPNTVSW